MFDLIAVGELNVDVILSGLKRPPEMGKEILADSYTELMGSSTAICACAASSLGLNTAFFGKLGMDAHGELVMRALERYNIHTGLLMRSKDYTTGVTVSMSMPADRAMVTYFGDTIDSFTAEDVPIESISARHLHVGSFFLQTKLQSGAKELFCRAHKAGMTVSLDAGWDDLGQWDKVRDVLSEVDFFFPNAFEAEAITGTADLDEAGKRLAALGCNAVIKNGSEGSMIYTKTGEVYRCGAFKVEAVDTTGAGDTFNAGFLCAYLNGKSYEECLRYGNAAGAVSVCYVGGTSHCPTAEDVARLIG